MAIQIPVGAWEPDKPALDAMGSREALNVIPKYNSYGPFPSFATVTDALTGRAQGAIFARKADGTGMVFAGDATKLYLQSGTAFSDVSRVSGGAYATPSDGRWSFVQFGPNVLATNGFDDYQTINIETDTDFTALAGSPPIPLYSCIVGDFVLTGNQVLFRTRIQWSAINDSADWVPSQTTQSDYQDLPDGGAIQAVLGYNYSAIVLQEFAIRLGSFEGPQLIFRFSKIAEGLGCSIPGSVAQYRDLVFFVGHSGIYLIQGGVQVTPIGDQRTNKWLRDNIHQSYLHRIAAAVDPVNSLYALGFPDQSSPDGSINHILLYHWGLDRFAHVQPGNLDFMYSGITQGSWTIEGLATAFGTIEAVPFPLDSPFWAGIAQPYLAGFGTNHKLGYFNGPSLAGTMTTTEMSLTPGKKSFLRAVRPLLTGIGTPSVSVALGTRNRQNDAVVYGNPKAQNAYGECKFRSNARYHRGKILTTAGDQWMNCQGLTDIRYTPMGTR